MFTDLKAVFSRVRSALRRRGASSHEAEDWAQEAWLRMAQHLQGAPVPNPEAYLTRTAINIGIDAYRFRAAHGTSTLDEDVLVADTAPGAEDQLLGKQRVERLRQGLARMPPRTRAILLAHRVDGRSYADIGREHGISETVVGEHVVKGTALLAGWMIGWR